MPHQRIKLKFLSPVSLHQGHDFLTIFDGQRIVDKLTGYVAFPKQYESVENTMFVQMDSSVFGQREGFLAKVSVIVDQWIIFFKDVTIIAMVLKFLKDFHSKNVVTESPNWTFIMYYTMSNDANDANYLK